MPIRPSHRHRALGLAGAIATLVLAFPAAAEWRRDNREACARLDQRLAAIESQRRMGYTPERGRRLQQEREKLTAKRRRECR